MMMKTPAQIAEIGRSLAVVALAIAAVETFLIAVLG